MLTVLSDTDSDVANVIIFNFDIEVGEIILRAGAGAVSAERAGTSNSLQCYSLRGSRASCGSHGGK